ncbi:S-layer homology domain-containing protein [Paenibacillus mesophilus]|uniref:S-layer homology domain-containing protein n=1 Tax=Paenibacillus mesophilus TaxID=2582849 RepID=UPI00110D4CC8|nr:S-layer homology domain-containing protein [Paenibacillus mesophilus]TMV47313.1 S-layer homology domain-containing protein [Paenibacillus mesophilus]
MNLKRHIRTISLCTAACLLIAMLAPVLAFAASTLNYFNYDKATGKLSGSVYVKDLSKVKVAVYDSAYRSMPLTLTELENYVVYDDKNVPIKMAKVEADLGLNNAPSKIELYACGQTLVAERTPYYDYYTRLSYYSPDSWRIGPKRTTGHQYFTALPAQSGSLPGSKLADFIVLNDKPTAIEIDLPYTNYANASTVVQSTYVSASDFVLTDITANQEVYISKSAARWTSIGLEFREPLIEGHQYVLKMSDTSDGKEFTLPKEGNTYKARISLGAYGSYSYVNPTSRAYFDNLNIGQPSPEGTANTTDSGSPLGTMDNCGTGNTGGGTDNSGGGTGNTGGGTGNTGGGTDNSGGGTGNSGGGTDNSGGGTGNTGGGTDNPGVGTDNSNSGTAEPSPTTPTGPAGTPTGPSEGTNGVKLGNGAATVIQETTPDGKTATKVILDGEQLGNAFGLLKNKDRGAQTVSIEAPANSGPVTAVVLPADILASAMTGTPDAVVAIHTEKAVFELPLRLLDLDSIARNFGTELHNVKVTVSIEQVSGAEEQRIKQATSESGLRLIGGALDFKLIVEGNGKQQEITDFGNTYAARVLPLNEAMDPSKATAIMYDPAKGTVTFVPSLFFVEDGKTKVKIMRNGNSVYGIVQSDKSFTDIERHWASRDIQLLASKLVVNGLTETTFGPEEKLTRAQFAALLVRSLGLTEQKPAAAFRDISSGEWYAGAVGAAVKAGIIAGYEDGTFMPDAAVTREQMAVMVSRALTFLGKTTKASAEQNRILNAYTDQASISDWSRASVALSVELGIMTGKTEQAFFPAEFTTRAQAATVLKRFLQQAGFIN